MTMPSAAGMAQDAIGFGRLLLLDQAHAAIAGDREPLVGSRNAPPRLPARWHACQHGWCRAGTSSSIR